MFRRLTYYPTGYNSFLSHLNRRERYLGRFGTWGWERRLRAGADVASRSRECLGIRPAPLSGSATEAGWTGTGSGAKSPCAKSPEARTGPTTPRRDAERRCRVPLFSGDPGNKPRPLPKVRLSAFRLPLLLRER